MKTWIGTIHSTYDDLEDLINFDEMYDICNKCSKIGITDAKSLWNANPIIGGSTNPKDFGVATMEEIVEIMVPAYKEAIEFTENYDVEFPEHEYSQDTEQKIREDISKFLCKVNTLLLKKLIEGLGSEFLSQFAHDLWLSRNGHGSGFFDGDYEGYEEDLQELAREMGECDAYVGDDGLIYLP